MRQMLLAATIVLCPAVTLSAHAQKSGGKADFSARSMDANGHTYRGQAPVGQTPAPSLSVQFGLDQLAAPLFELSAIDRDFYLAQDEDVDSRKPLRFGIERDVFLAVEMGEWIQVEGGKLWRIDITADGSMNGRLSLTGLHLDAGQQITMSVPNMDGSAVGPIEGVGEFNNGTAWGLCMPGPLTRLEWFVPTGGVAKELPFDGVVYCHGYRNIFGDAYEGIDGGDGGVAGNCHNDPLCFAAWVNESNAAVRLLFGGALCSGQLIATTAADETPYVSTANHCISTQSEANSCQFLFFYRNSPCGGGIVAGTTVTGGDFTSTYFASDCTLLMIRPTLPTTVYWAGWTNTNPALNTASTGIHHPGGAEQAISFGVKNASSFNCGTPSGNWNSLSWNNGITEGGSSGSAIYRDSDHKLFGVLTCGASSCSQTGADDGYGRWDLAVNNGGFGTLLAAGSDDAQEQNDTCATARALTAGTYTGLVVKRLDEDWYALPVPSGSSLTVSMTFTHANGDVDVQLFNTCGGAVVLDRNANTSNESFNYSNSSASNTIYMRVYLGADTRNDYSLTFSVSTPAPSNDNCLTSVAVLAGSYPFNTSGATGSTPTVTASCSDGAMNSINKDVWWTYTATCNGLASATTCGAAYDSSIVVYNAASGCPTAATAVVACNNNGAGCGTASTAQWNATLGSSWYVRVGSTSNVGGAGTLVLSCTVVCPADQDGSGSIDGADLAALLNAWGTNDAIADIDDSGSVDGADLAALLNGWGACP